MRSARAAGLAAALLVAHGLALAGTTVPFTFWSPAAFLWQDALVVLVFAILDFGLFLAVGAVYDRAQSTQHRSRAVIDRAYSEAGSWAVYGGAILYIALNAGVERTIHSPLTWTMLRAAGAPLADSAITSLTPSTVFAILAPATAGLLTPIFWRRTRWQSGWPPLGIALSILVACVALGPYASSRVDTGGRQRNAFGALWPLSAPRRPDAPTTSDWRTSPVDPQTFEDLTSYRGRAAGRNVIVIILESTAAQYLGLYGAKRDPMPNLSASATGLVFQNAFAVYPESIKGLLPVLCSRYPAFGVAAEAYDNFRCPALPEQLRAAGYRTALFHSGRFMYLGMNAVIRNRGFNVLDDAGAIGGEIESSFGVDEPATVKHLLSFIDSVPAGQRFFAMYLPTAGHHPYATPTPGPFKDDGQIGSYLNALHYGDESLGTLFQHFRQRGLDRNTLFVVFGDHGEAFGQHEGNFAHTMFLNNENVRVPFAISAPGLLNAARVNRTVSLIDTAPTILDLLGLPIPAGYQGSSMLEPQQRMSLFFTDYSLGWLGLVDGCWKALHETGTRRTKLFDVCMDPGETQNIAEAHPERTQVYRARMEDWIAAQRVQ